VESGAWPFFCGGLIFLVFSIKERELNLLKNKLKIKFLKKKKKKKGVNYTTNKKNLS